MGVEVSVAGVFFSSSWSVKIPVNCHLTGSGERKLLCLLQFGSLLRFSFDHVLIVSDAHELQVL